MKLQQAQELYSEYRDDSLSPAMKLALEQFFESNPGARRDYDSFCAVLESFAKAEMPELDPPQGFRASILERIVTEQAAQRRTSFADMVRDWFGGSGTRRLAGAGVAALAIGGILIGIHQHSGSPIGTGGFGVETPSTVTQPSAVLGVGLKTGDDGNQYHLFRIHLPESVSSAQVTAEVLADPSEVTDSAARAADAQPALKQPVDLTNDEELQIPVAVTQQEPAGTTLDLLVQWQPDDNQNASGSQVVFTPVVGSAAVQQEIAPESSAGFYQTLQYIAANYHVTVICDASADSSLQVSPWDPTTDPSAAIKAAADAGGYQVHVIDASTYQLYK